MPAFDRETESDRLDYRLMIRSPVRLVHSRELLADVVAWLTTHGYEVVEIDASWLATTHMFRDIGNAVGSTCHDQWQCLCEGTSAWISGASGRATGFALVLTGFDVFASLHIDDARLLLAAIAQPCWSSMVVGRRAMCLVQTDDPSLYLGRVGVWPLFLGDWELGARSQRR